MIRLSSLRRRPSVSPASSRPVAAGQLSWSHLGRRYRVTAWPEAVCEAESEGRWQAVEPSEAVVASAALVLTGPSWRRYLEFVPTIEREFLEQFAFGRLAALRVVVACPEMLGELREYPALTPFLAAHAALRGTGETRWTELRALHERGGIYAVLEWLGLPACKETLLALRNLVAPDVPRRLLEPLRASLWCPATRQALQRGPAVSDRELAHYCHALAA